MKIESVRARLTVYYVVSLGTALLVVGGLIYALLARALYTRIDDSLIALSRIAETSLVNDLAEGQGMAGAAESTVEELWSRGQMLAIYDPAGKLIAERGRDDDLEIVVPDAASVPSDEPLLFSLFETDDDDRHRLAARMVSIPGSGATFLVIAGISLEPTDEELESLREILAYVVPIALALAGGGGWFLARQSLAPVAAMAERARRLGVEDLSGRLPVANEQDELGHLAVTFNDLLARLEASLTQQRRFMADASHELRTPVATSRAAASVALQQPHRPEEEYREALTLVDGQMARLSRIVEDMFTLARADAGSYPVRRTLMYLDEVIGDVVRGSRVLASQKSVSIDLAVPDGPGTAFEGDEDLVRRLVGNLIDNAIRYAPEGSAVGVALRTESGGYTITVTDRGPGIPPDIQPHIFTRFYRGDSARTRPAGGAGLGLALARWIASVHGGGVVLARSSADGTTFRVTLPGATERPVVHPPFMPD